MAVPQFAAGKTATIILTLLVAGVLATVAIDRERWLAFVGQQEPTSVLDMLEQHELEHDHEDEHDHGAHGEGNAIALSDRGLKNIGYEPFVVEMSDYQRMLALPAIVVERPGRSQIHLTAPLTGVVTKIHSVTGEAVEPGKLLFEVRLTHEDLVAAQRDFLRTVENLGVVEREIERLKSLDEGVIAGKRILEREYERQKLEASLHAESQAMLLHGLTQPQVDSIRESGQLFQDIKISAPKHNHEDDCAGDHPFQMQELAVTKGQQIEAGSHLAVLGDHCELQLEAIAFEDDAPLIREATQTGHKIIARPVNAAADEPLEENLEVLYVAGHIDTDSRAFKVYLRLPNRLVLDKQNANGKRFVEWQYKPGQRMLLSVPVETWEDQLVLPTTAVVDEGAESYVYHQHGDHFDQVAVHVMHRDQNAVVIAADDAVHAGDTIAGKGAYQIHLALKNQAGGGVDPHAGHDH